MFIIAEFVKTEFDFIPGGRVSEVGPRAVGVVVIVAVVVQHLSTRENVTIWRAKIKFAFWEKIGRQRY